ncbi:hypothetical protein [Roseivirga sp. UBA838]|uniref:hypothetical protein n=1 Tax=Roseivirga sp. UBA838 TaxID=1947393 RepID=UPI00257EE33F|nr:hypothetical protein [Roseivirga sp. UBA838]|tara:strand:+ start:32007 stop:32663 length:657 start_codon:yes stop_codon:yes gene_type:complete
MTKFKVLITLVIFIFIINVSYAQNRLYEHPNFPQIAAKHQMIAILPFKATVNLRPKQMEQMTSEQLADMSKLEGYNIQESMYSWFLTRKGRGEMVVNVQNTVETNAILEKNGFEYNSISKYTPKELAGLLGVDAVIMGSFETSKPMSEGASIALGLLIGFWGSTDKAVLNMFIYNGEDGETLFNYNRAVNGSLGTNTDNLINRLMRKSSRKIAYTNKK